MKFFRYDSGFWSVTGKIFDLMVLNFLWFITSLPLVTMGAASAALSAVTMQMARGEEPPLLRGYFSAFSAHWKGATALWLSCLGVLAWLVLGLAVCAGLRSPVLRLSVIPEGALLLMCLLGMQYVFPLCAEREAGLGETLKSAMYLSLLRLPWSCVLALLTFVPVGITLFVPKAFPLMLMLWIFLGAGGISYARSQILRRLFACGMELPAM